VYSVFKEQYCKLIDQFVNDLGLFCANGMPAIHIPIMGKNYENSMTKMAFFGIETDGWHSFQEFMEIYTGVGDKIGSTEEAFDYLVNSTEPIKYLEWTNNPHTSFWDYIFQFLITFYQLPEPILQNNKDYRNILESFIWGNTNSMERYHVTAKKQGSQYNDWEHIKNCSKIFDKAKYVLEICKPDIMLILNWGEDEKWLTDNQNIEHFEIDPHHWYYSINNTNVYWLPHPRYTSSPKGIGFGNSIQLIIKDFQSRKNGI